MILISDCLGRLGYRKVLTKINQSYFDHSHQFRMHCLRLRAKYFKFFSYFSSKMLNFLAIY